MGSLIVEEEVQFTRKNNGDPLKVHEACLQGKIYDPKGSEAPFTGKEKRIVYDKFFVAILVLAHIS